MKRRAIGVALVAGLMASTAQAAANFASHWTQASTKTPCSIILGFRLKADGTAQADWAFYETGNHAKYVVEHRDGHWTSTGDTLHVSIIDVSPGPLRSVTTEVKIDGPVAGGNRFAGVITDSRDRSIDGDPYEIRCAYTRDK